MDSPIYFIFRLYLYNMFCINCGAELETDANFCEYCGADLSVEQKSQSQETREIHRTHITHTEVYVAPTTHSSYSPYGQESPKSMLVLILLWFFFGVLGVHYFYVGRIGMGILWLLTGGMFGIGWVVDIFVILTGQFKDSMGRVIKRI
jgi:restriction system protein